MRKHTVSSLSFSFIYIFMSENHLHDNKQPYNHAGKLPDGRPGWIRFSCIFKLSGSVPRRGNKQSGVFRCAAPGHPGQDKTQHMGCRLDGKATVTTIYGLRRPQRAGCSKEDPTLPFFGSDRKKRETVCTVRTVCIICIVCTECIVLYLTHCTVFCVLRVFYTQDTLCT